MGASPACLCFLTNLSLSMADADASPLPPFSDSLFAEFDAVSTDDWEAKIREDLGSKSYEDVLVWDSLEGVKARAYYRQEDYAKRAHVDGSTGPPALAGSAGGEAANAWRIRQDVAAPDFSTAQRHARNALDGGASDLGLVATPQQGRLYGLPLHDQKALDTLTAEWPLEDIGLHLQGGPAAPALWAMLHNVAAARGVAPTQLRVTTDYDPAALLARGEVADTARIWDLAAALARQPTERAGTRALAVQAVPYHNAGASIAQTLGSALGALATLLDRLSERGISADSAMRAVQVVVPVGTSFFLEIAKLRALRLLVPQVVNAFADAQQTEASAADAPLAPSDVFVQAVTSRRMQTVYGPYVNMLRGTTAATAAVLGGCDVCSVAPYDAAVRAPEPFGLRIARNTQLILQREAHLDHVRDPGAGAYYLEVLTDKLARAGWAFFQSIEAHGGLINTLRSGWLHQQIADVRAQRKAEVADRSRIIVGTNHYPDLEETRLSDVRAEDADDAVAGGDDAPAEEQASSFNGPPPSIDALRAHFDAGGALIEALPSPPSLHTADSDPEFAEPASSQPEDAVEKGALEKEASEAQAAIQPLPAMRIAAPFETLRLRTERHAEAHDGPPTVSLLPMGHRALRSVRATFARNFFGVAGFAIDEHLRFETIDDAVDAVADADADIAVLCSSDPEYADLAPALIESLNAAGLDPLVVVAGAPDSQAALRDQGVDAFIHRGAPLLDTLETFQERLGMKAS